MLILSSFIMTCCRQRLTVDNLSSRVNNLTDLQTHIIDESKAWYAYIKKLTIVIWAMFASINLIVSLYVAAYSIDYRIDFKKFITFQYCILNIFCLIGVAVRIYLINKKVLKPLLNTWTEVKQMGGGKKPLFFTFFLFFIGIILFFIAGPLFINAEYYVSSMTLTVWIYNCIIYSNFIYRFYVSSYLWKIIEHQNTPDATTTQC